MSSILHQYIRRVGPPLLVHPVIGHQGLQLRPEAGLWFSFTSAPWVSFQSALAPMGQLVGNDVVDQRCIVLDQPPVRPEAAAVAARALRSNIFPWR